ncbi:unnamed protein product [Protopolystoma xenopodis]|uniref:Uncharacterized protein n=1 Tax=Protopolystoma xenopodis TaxID=117903 RepID=A0A3S5B126_9PLAT|nr:unnamed protein product [Protopolystoma xenopodis]
MRPGLIIVKESGTRRRRATECGQGRTNEIGQLGGGILDMCADSQSGHMWAVCRLSVSEYVGCPWRTCEGHWSWLPKSPFVLNQASTQARMRPPRGLTVAADRMGGLLQVAKASNRENCCRVDRTKA